MALGSAGRSAVALLLLLLLLLKLEGLLSSFAEPENGDFRDACRLRDG